MKNHLELVSLACSPVLVRSQMLHGASLPTKSFHSLLIAMDMQHL